VKEIDTKGLVSDARWEPSPDDIYEVTGAETYETVAGGTKTVFVLSKMRRKEEQAVQKAPDPFAKLPEEVAKYARARQADEVYLLEQLREMQDALAETSKRIQDAPAPEGKAALSGQLQARQAIVADLLEQLREMQDANIRPLCGPIAPMWRTMQRLKMKVGDIGRFPSFQRTSVIQVFEDKILVNFDWGNVASRNSPDRTGVLFVKGIDTKGIVSDAKWRPSTEDIFEVTGTETYETVAGGTKTVFVLSRVRTDRIQAYVKAKAEENRRQEEMVQEEARKAREATEKAEEERKATAEKARWRMWSDSDGTFEFEARISGVINDNVVLKKRDGGVVRIPLEKLSSKDQEWVKRWIELHSKPR